jgi:hypothetical protein
MAAVKIHLYFISRQWRRQKFTCILSPANGGGKNSLVFYLPPFLEKEIHLINENN